MNIYNRTIKTIKYTEQITTEIKKINYGKFIVQ